jgi:hypothetical protein
MSIKLTIPEACHEDWQKMQPDKDGRHCLSCQKTVVDFSLMTDKEILDYISSKGDNLCGRFDRHQLNRGLHENKLRKRFSWAYAWALTAVGFFYTGKAKAQGNLIAVEKIQQLPKEKPLILGRMTKQPIEPLEGYVKDARTGLMVPFATISIKKRAVTSTDSSGKFILKSWRKGSELDLTISAVGYASQTITLDKRVLEWVTIFLVPEVKELEPVVVNGSVMGALKQVTVCHSTVAGAVITMKKVSKTEKFTRAVKDWFQKKDIVVYPNPLSPGNTMKVDLKLKETGQYRLELIDASGKIVWIRSMNIPAKQFTISVPAQLAWSAGVYWLRISGTHTKNVYNSRVVIQ